MHPVITPPGAARQHGFSMLEAMVAVAVLGVLVAVGVPRMNEWVLASKAAAASEFYAEGIRLARAQAVGHNSAARITLDENAVNGQMDWQVDICYPTAALPCSDTSGVWSTTTTIATGDPEGTVAGFKSVQRLAVTMPAKTDLVQTFLPLGTSDIYFTSLGWVDTNVPNRLQRITLTPSPARMGAFATSALVVSLAGMVSKCDPTVAAHDSRGCPP